MEYVHKFLTGSREFWHHEGTDADYLIVRDQDVLFQHERIEGDCYFCYRNGLSKAEFLEWQTSQNWYLNTGSLITRAWLECLGIDIFDKDREAVYKIHEKLFNFVYRNTRVSEWLKYAYRLYIFVCFIKNNSFELTPEQLDSALKFKQKSNQNIEAVKEIYQFFNAGLDAENALS